MPDASPAPRPSPRALLLRELPLILGLLAGLWLLLHPAMLRFGYPHGADWANYLECAGHLHLDPELFPYNEWRKPLYPWLVGLLGQLGSYVAAAQWLALGGALCTVLGAGLLARVLAGSWAGGLAALSAGAMSVVVDGSWWVNPYPLVGGVTAVALAAGAWTARWPHPVTALLAGLAGGLAWALDGRGVVVAAAVPLLAALAPLAPRRRALLVGLALLGLAVAPSADRGLVALHDLPQRSLSSQLEMQHSLPRGPYAKSDPAVAAEARACKHSRGPADGLASLWDECAQQRRAVSVRLLRRFGHIPPVLPALGALLLVLLPAGWGRRSSLVAAAVFLPTVAVTALAMSWVPYVERYILPSAVLLACLGPVALLGLVAVLGRRWPGRWVAVTGPLLGLACLLLVFPRMQPGDLLSPLDSIARRKGESPDQVDPRELLAGWARDELGPDDLLLDCSELRLDVLFLPAELSIQDGPPQGPWCREQIAAPPEVQGELWLLTRHHRGGVRDSSLPDARWVESRGWREEVLGRDLDPLADGDPRSGPVRRWRWVGR